MPVRVPILSCDRASAMAGFRALATPMLPPRTGDARVPATASEFLPGTDPLRLDGGRMRGPGPYQPTKEAR